MLKKLVEIVIKMVYSLVVDKLKSKAQKIAWVIFAVAAVCFLAFAFTVWWPLLLAAVVLVAVGGMILITLRTLANRS
jgi:chromate transport protein ChrA